jgi:sec-independent protein translocase protein TatC
MADKQKSEMTFLEHLEDLRWHLIRSVVVVLIASVVAFIYKHIVFDIIILGPSQSDFISNELFCRFGHWTHDFLLSIGLNGGDPNSLCLNSSPIKLQNFQMAGQFMAHIKISFICGLILGFPYIVYEFWKFVSPALYPKERKHARTAVLAISLLFFIGVLFGYFVIAPLSINFLINYKTSDLVQNIPQLSSYISVISSISFSGGIAFELPAVIYFLSKVGLVTPEFLKKYRRHAIIVLLIIAAIITPPDVFSQILVSIPLILLYEVSIGVSKRIVNKKKKE